MNSLEAEYFSELSKDRSESADLLEKPSMRGIKKSVVEKYSDQAHFIYELLQNADDAHAVNARFILEHGRLIFAHDGARHFSVSDPANEDEDSEHGHLGDINSITSIANSTKTEASIGKFGVGFKAVFQYTKTPRIYDPEFRFEIDRFIVPNLIPDDIPERRPEETLFEFPFNHPDRSAEEAYSDISKKLKSLSFPLLFLSSLKNIEFVIGEKSGHYGKTIEKTFIADPSSVLYELHDKCPLKIGDTSAERILLTRNDGEASFSSRLWLFSRTYDGEHRYSVGYFVNDDGQLTPVNRPAFCFFTTKEATGLSFMIHAPFHLTDSREGIRAGVKHNEQMIDLLADLSADALSYLKEIGIKESVRIIDDGIVNVIPVDPSKFSDPDDKDRVSFMPFYTAIKKKLGEDELLPAKGGYVFSENAYWAQYAEFTDLFSNEQLGDLVENSRAKWVFPSISRDSASNNKPLRSYIDSIVKTNLDADAIIIGRNNWYSDRYGNSRPVDTVPIIGITAGFIEKQSIPWLHRFYKWMSETKRRTEYSKSMRIFLDQDGHATAAYDKDGNLVLFLPLPGTDMSGYNVVNQKLLEDKETVKFLKEIGLKQPSIRDQIYNIILPLYKKGGNLDTVTHFRLFFEYFLKCPHEEVDKFIQSIKELEFLRYSVKDSTQINRGKADSLYLPNDDLCKYFETKKDARFIDIDGYRKIVGENREDKLFSFLNSLGVKQEPAIKDVQIEKTWLRKDLPHPHHSNDWDNGHDYCNYYERIIDGCKEIIEYIESNEDKTKSLLFWRYLVKITQTVSQNSYRFSRYGNLWIMDVDGNNALEDALHGYCEYFFRSPQTKIFTSSNAVLIKTRKWLATKNGNFVSPYEITVDDLPDAYDKVSGDALILIKFLGFRTAPVAEEPSTIDQPKEEEEDDSNLTDKQREEIGLAKQLKDAGINNAEELQELLAIKRERDAKELLAIIRERDAKKAAQEAMENSHLVYGSAPDPSDSGQDNSPESGDNDQKGKVENLRNNKPDSSPEPDDSEWPDEDKGENGQSDTSDEDLGTKGKETRTASSGQTSRSLKTKKKIWKEIAGLSQQEPRTSQENIPAEDDDSDSDDLTPSTVDYSRRIDRAKEKSATELNKIAHLQELQERALTAPTYSYGWFSTLLEMESLSNAKDSSNGGKEVSISFSLIEREPGTERTLVLKHPNRYIPQFMEELADIPMILHMGDMTKTVAIEVASVRSYTLRVKMKNATAINGIDLSSVNEVSITAQSPAFLLEELRKQFIRLGEKLNLTDDYDMQKNLCENIEFIFGPPGTGKTTYLAKNVLRPLMSGSGQCRVLVLTPTNKAADVLVHRVMETAVGSRDYEKWLIRFGATGDEEIEQSPVFKEKDFNILSLEKSITVTTIARFPYDYFMADGKWIFLNGVKWDYIVIDEASMIPLVNIVYPLYCKTPRKFIIAGDPFQIEPIASVDLWKDENIYKMVQLKSFTDPQTVPHKYAVKLLTTQYRSVPDIGGIFSRFAYGGILQHSRSAADQKPLNLKGIADVRTLNILKFPVSRYESIYRAKRLRRSSSYQVYSALFTFEYICFLSKALAARNPGKLFKIGVIAPYRAQADIIDKLLASERLPREVDVQAGTIHGFQGDECDIIFAVFNAPPSITGSSGMFLNKRNIINVAISRARDYLFIVMPDDSTENVGSLTLIKRVERLIKSTGSWHEELTPDLEKLMFGDSHYLENNSFSTSHQSVNVYGLPERRYEVRAEDNAVDIQIHRGASKAAAAQTGSGLSQESKAYTKTYEKDGSTATVISQKETEASGSNWHHSPAVSKPAAIPAASTAPQVKYKKGEIIRVVSGLFNGMYGVIEDINYLTNKVKVTVSFMNRPTSVSMSLTDIAKRN